MKNINGIEYTIDMVENMTAKGRMLWNEAQTSQHQAPKHSTVKFRVLCEAKWQAEAVNAALVRRAYQVAAENGCTMQHSGGMTNRPNAVKFGVTFHGENSEACASEILK